MVAEGATRLLGQRAVSLQRHPFRAFGSGLAGRVPPASESAPVPAEWRSWSGSASPGALQEIPLDHQLPDLVLQLADLSLLLIRSGLAPPHEELTSPALALLFHSVTCFGCTKCLAKIC